MQKFIYLFLFSIATVYGQLSGTVSDEESGTPLPGVSVFIKNLKIGSVTDTHGHYVINNIPAGTYEVVCLLIGYKEFRKTITIHSLQSLDIKLKASSLEMSETTVEGIRENQKEYSHQVTVMDEKKLDEHRGQTLGETLKDVPGVTLLTTGASIAKPVIRGLHSSRIVTVNQGVTQEGQQWGGEHAPEIDPFSAQRVEVIKGAAGVAYGTGAIGGVIRIDQKDLPEEGQFGGEATMNFFSNNRQGSGSLMMEQGLSSLPGVAWRVRVSGRKAGNWKTPSYGVDNTGFEELNYTLAGGYHRSNWGIESFYSHFGTNLAIYKGSHIGSTTDLISAIRLNRKPLSDANFTYRIDNPSQSIAHDLVSVLYHLQTRKNDRVEIQTGYQINHRQEYDAHKPLGLPPQEAKKPSFDLYLYTQTLDVKYQLHPMGAWITTFGANGMRQNNVNQALRLIPSFHSYNGGLYWIEKFSKEKWTIETGLRYDSQVLSSHFDGTQKLRLGKDSEKKKYQSVTAVVDGTYALTDEWSIASNLASAWRPPGVNELYSDGVHHGTAQYEIGNSKLNVEKSYNGDFSLRHYSKNWSFDAGVFVNYIRNYIYLNPQKNPTLTVRGAFPTFKYFQTDARLTGMDGSAAWEMNSFLRWETTWSIVRGENMNIHEPLIYMPSDRIRLAAHIHLPETQVFKESFIEFSGNFVRKQTKVSTNAEIFASQTDSVIVKPPSGYRLFELSIGTDTELFGQKCQWRLSVYNLFNTKYADYLSRFRYYVYDPGRNIVLRINIPFGA